MATALNTSRKSPNHSNRLGHPVRLCLIHATVGGLESSLNWLCSPLTRVSSHYVISQTGIIYQLVAETAAAWHAGDAIWQGETAVNEISIGVELENRTGMRGFKGQDPYPGVQLDRLVDLSRNLASRYPAIVFARHLDVALPKGRKTDPAGFDWAAFRARLGASPSPLPPAPTPAPVARAYRVRGGLPVYQRPERTGPLWGFLALGEEVIADETGHLLDERGWVDLNGLVAK